MRVLGLTGSIGMGKSTTAEMFRERGIPVFDSDAAVHRLYAGALAGAIEAAFPGTTRDGTVDRALLRERVLGDKAAMARLEGLVHPAVRAETAAFLGRARMAGHRLAVLDIPLLFETGRDREVDAVVVVTADPDVQRQRVLARPGMTEETLAAILARQLPDADKRRRADHVIDTGLGLDHARGAVAAIIAAQERG